MTDTRVPSVGQPEVLRASDPSRRTGWQIAGVGVFIWFGIAMLVVVTGYRLPNFDTGVPTTIIAAIGLPFGTLALLWHGSRAVRNWIHGIDLLLLTPVQCWRTAGALFLVLWAFDILPATIARNGGIGDVLTGIFAAFAVAGLLYRRNFGTSRLYLAFHIFGIVDLLLAIVSGALAVATMAAYDSSAPSILPLVQYPLFIVPMFLVPFFLLCHVLALLRIRALKNTAASL